MDFLDFISRHMGLIVITAVVIFVLRAVRVLLKAGKTDREGIETDGVDSRLEEE